MYSVQPRLVIQLIHSVQCTRVYVYCTLYTCNSSAVKTSLDKF